jgi:hypothetical protein
MEGIISFIQGNIISVLVTGGIGALVAIGLDRLLLFLNQTFYPAVWLLDMAKDLNSKIEGLKKKYPSAGADMENKVIKTLRDSADFIEKN